MIGVVGAVLLGLFVLFQNVFTPTAQVTLNPENAYCVQSGGTLQQEKEGTRVLTICVFTTGVHCEVHDFYAGTCSPLDVRIMRCSDESRTIDFCHDVYSPVCGTDKRNRQETYPNGCYACLNPSIKFYQEGECLN